MKITEALLRKEYEQKKRSWKAIAEDLGTYPNKLRRAAKKFGIKSRTKSEAQKEALEQGRSNHPTEGRERTEKEKLKISASLVESWDNLSEKERKRRRKLAKDNWDSLSKEEQTRFINIGIKEIRKTTKTGSKLEKFLNESLTSAGYLVLLHQEQLIKNENMHIDLFLPSERIAIEVDGPSHHENVWGSKVLARTQQADKQKNGLLLRAGYAVIRVRQPKRVNKVYKVKIVEELLACIKNLKADFPTNSEDRYFEL